MGCGGWGEEVSFGAWEVVTSPKIWGGLGVKDLKIFKKSLLANGYGGSGWGDGEVIGDKYGIKDGDWKTRDIVLPFGSDLWRNIMKG